MPERVIIIKFDNRSGIDIKAKYPEGKLKIKENTFMHIFNLHEFSKQAGIANLTLENTNFATYYSGSDTAYYFILILNIPKIQKTMKKF